MKLKVIYKYIILLIVLMVGTISFFIIKNSKEVILEIKDEKLWENDNSLFKNLNFEEGNTNDKPFKWGIWNSNGEFNAIIDSSVSKLGKNSVRLFSSKESENSRGTLSQSIAEIPTYIQGKAIRVTQWIKTENFIGNGLKIRLQYNDTEGNKIKDYPIVSIPILGDQDWIKYEYIIELPQQEVSNLQFEYLYDNASGDVWIDDIIINPYESIAQDNYLDILSSISVEDDIEIRVEEAHPKLLATQSEFNKLKKNMKKDENLIIWFETFKEEADKILEKDIVTYEKPDGLRLKTLAAEYIVDLSFMYKITGDTKYAERAWKEIENVCLNYEDWSDEHLLDTANISFGIAIGYDWLYDYLTSEQRSIIEVASKEKALDIVLPMYQNSSHFFIENKFNWNSVCNGGFLALSLALSDSQFKDLALEVVTESLKSVKNGLVQYYSNGAYIEGTSYWNYGTRYLVYYFAMLDSAVKNKFNFIEFEGLSETGEFPIYMIGNNGTFNFSDNSTSLPYGYMNLWFAKKFKNSDLTWYHKYYMQEVGKVSVYDLLWYDKKYYKGEELDNLDKYYEKQSLVTMRSSWSDKEGVFLGLKGGENGSPHGDLDIGSFVFDALGVRWAIDLGTENYNLPGYWDMSNKGLRWSYYRKKAEGHNTLLINPNSLADQFVEAKATIIDKNLDEKDEPFAIVDITPAYNEAISINRGFKLLNNRKELLIRDEYELSEECEIVWQMHTEAKIEIIGDGKAAVLYQDNKKLYVKLITDENIKLEVTEAKSYFNEINSGETVNKGIKKLVAKGNSRSGTINIWMVPLENDEKIPNNIPEIKQLSQW